MNTWLTYEPFLWIFPHPGTAELRTPTPYLRKTLYPVLLSAPVQRSNVNPKAFKFNPGCPRILLQAGEINNLMTEYNTQKLFLLQLSLGTNFLLQTIHKSPGLKSQLKLQNQYQAMPSFKQHKTLILEYLKNNNNNNKIYPTKTTPKKSFLLKQIQTPPHFT